MRGVAKYCAVPILAMFIAGAAYADPVSLSVNFNVWQGTNPNPGDQTDPTQQALPSNPVNAQNYIGFFSYSGPINFSDTDQSTDLMSNFIPGAGLPAMQMSSPSFDLVTLFEFTFVLPDGVTIASITHDDGISLYDLTDNTDNLIPGNEGPTMATTTMLPALIAGHNYELWYAATNGAPSILVFNSDTGAVPEPASWALLAMGFGGLGYAIRRQRRTTYAAMQ